MTASTETISQTENCPKPTLREAYAFCRNITKRRAKNFYYAFLFLPRLKRQAIYAVYAFCRYSDDLADDPNIKDRTALFARWKQDLEQCYQGEVNHPILIALQDTVQRFRIPKEYFDQLLEGMLMDLSITRYRTFDELYQYAYHAASVVGLICIEIFGYKNVRTREYAKNLGIALQLTNILRDVKEDAERGRIYLPQEDLERFHYSEKDLLERRMYPSFIKLMEFQAARALYYYEKASRLIPPEDRNLLTTAEIMKNIYLRMLQEITRQGYDVFKHTVHTSKLTKIFIAVKTWLQIRLGGKL